MAGKSNYIDVLEIFSSNSLYSIGIEEEYMICCPNSGDLLDKANHIMRQVSSNPLDGNDLTSRFSYELLLSEIESNTKVCSTSADAIENLRYLRNVLKLIGDKENYKIGISGTHPFADTEKQIFVDNESYNWVKNQMQYYASQNVTFSTHIHVGLKCPEDAIKVTNSIRRWIAPLLALSSNSPFFNKKNTGMKSSRTFQFGIFPRTNIPYYMHSMDDYLNLLELLKTNSSIDKPRHIWWKVRPHVDLGTVEFRMCDVQRSLNRTHMLVSIAQALVHTIHSNELFNDSNYNHDILDDGLWNASRYGIHGNLIDPLNNKAKSMKNMIEEMINFCSDSLKYFDNYDSVKKMVHLILDEGTEADLQIKIFNEKGMEGLIEYLIDTVDY